ncbi:MAG TPA: hypothetical protein VLV28_02050 [Gaiellaceae bacterium]|nr:hypothetical protein [Gaiellaceae bacterium]
MAKPKSKSVLTQLQSVGEDALGRLTSNPAAKSALQRTMQWKDKGGKVFMGFDAIDARLTAIEKRLSALEGSPKKRTTTSRTRSRSSSTKTAAKPPASASKTNAAS